MEKSLKKIKNLKKVFYFSSFLFGLSFIIFSKTELGEKSNQISSISFFIFAVISICSFLEMSIVKGKINQNKINEQNQYYYLNYIKSLNSKDKRDVTYWGYLYYGYYKCFTIHQQTCIQLRIQNDILSHS
jgi:hypothetical protein